MTEEEKWKLRFQRERKARKESERILEEKSRELYSLNQDLTEERNKLDTIFQTTVEGIAILDLEGNFLFLNKAYELILGYKVEELLTKNYIEQIGIEDRSGTEEAFESVLKNNVLQGIENHCTTKDGKKLLIGMSIALMPNKKSFLVTVKDITEVKNKEKKMKDYINLIDHNIITSTTDLSGMIIDVSNAFCKISGYSKYELIGKNHKMIKHSDIPNSLFENLWNCLSNNQPWKGEIKNLKKDGSSYWVDLSISIVFDENNNKSGYTAIGQDVTTKKIIEEISITDGLTEIYNRRHFNNVFPKIINSSKRDNSLVAFLIMDIDYFKQYNDTYGHQMGDNALIEVAKAIKNSLHRATDYFFRLGGEEFGIIFKAETTEKAELLANSIKNKIEGLHIEHKKSTVSNYITTSIGLICQHANDIKSDDEMYKQADKLLYKAKDSGRNKVMTNC